MGEDERAARRSAVEAIIDAAARWGWDAARSGLHTHFPAPVVTWDDDDRPSLSDPRQPDVTWEPEQDAGEVLRIHQRKVTPGDGNGAWSQDINDYGHLIPPYFAAYNSDALRAAGWEGHAVAHAPTSQGGKTLCGEFSSHDIIVVHGLPVNCPGCLAVSI